jgi:osmotically-inducible protein OsmY
MSDYNRWSNDRDSDRSRDDYRTETQGGDRYGRGSIGRDHSYGEASRGRGDYENRAFADRDRGYDPWNSAGPAYGEENHRNRSYGTDPRGRQGYDDRQTSGAYLHQGYRAPLGGVHGDRQGYDNSGYRDATSRTGDHTRYQYNNYSGDNRPYDDLTRDYRARGDQGRGWWDQTRDEVSSWFGDDEAARRRHLDEARANSHSGRGPKGYTRSDDRIREDVNDRLTDDHHLDASDIDVKVSNGEVTLTGNVSARNDKRRAEDIVDHIAGVKHVQNNLRVKDTATSAASASSVSTSGSTGTTSIPRSN